MRQAIVICVLFLASVVVSVGQDKEPTPPPYCKPCLFYGGDFDPGGPTPNVGSNGDDLLDQGTLYVPFSVPPGQTWIVTGLFSNNVLTRISLAPPEIEWSISTGISQGNAGTLVASGTAKATLTPTGRSWDGMSEYTALGRLSSDELVTLAPGHYWMTAVPVCTYNLGNHPPCGGATYYMTDVEDAPPPHAKGFESTDESYLYLPGAFYFVEMGGPNGLCAGGNGGGCDKFSAGLIGTAQSN